jgi:hypothetical protein
MNPLIFLDIDDVLCLSAPYGGYDVIDIVNDRHPDPAAVYRELFRREACAVLRRVHDTLYGALRYVISSSWRQALEREQLDTVFRQSGLDFVADRLYEGEGWCTPITVGRSRRADEIAAWLDSHHQGESFVIIDDTWSGPSLLTAMTLDAHPFNGRIVLCRENVGLGDEHVPPILDALKRPVPSGSQEGSQA